MKVLRTVHPVGVGAFITEQFFEDNGNLQFCAVYNCGSMNTNELTNLINTFDKSWHINVLFISHFDHISGIMSLIDNKFITQNRLD